MLRGRFIAPRMVLAQLRPALPQQPASASPLLRSTYSSFSSGSSSGSGSGSKPPSPSAASASTLAPGTKPPPKALKPIKPSSKANARSSRLLRSQLVKSPGSITPDGGAASLLEQASLPAEDASDASSALKADATPMPQLKQVFACATASSYDFTNLIASGRLPPDWQLLEDGQVIYLPSWPVHQHPSTHGQPASYTSHHASSGEVFILRSGAYVTWGLNIEQARRFRSLVLTPRSASPAATASASASASAVERGTYGEIGEEELDFVRDDNEFTRIVGDVLIIGQAPPTDSDLDGPHSTPDDPWSPLLARLSFSAGLALSARLSSQESSLSTYLESVRTLPDLLETKGRVPISRRDVVRKMGRLLKLRQMVNLEEGSKVEELELFWENARMEQHYDSICLTLDIEPRFRALNEQLDHAENLMGVLRALLTEGSSHRMELVIIALIAIEVTLALVSHGYLSNPFADGDADAEGESNAKERALMQHGGGGAGARI